MRLQILSDLHLETEDFDPVPAPGADLLVLAGDVDSGWAGFERFRGWPVPVIYVAGNHEFEGRDLDAAWPALRERVEALGFTMLERQSLVVPAPDGRRIRFLGTVRWCDFDLFGAAQRERAMRAATYFMKVMHAKRFGGRFDAPAVREEALACRAWLAEALHQDEGADATVVVTHFAPSLRSADPRYGSQPGTASFCNADDELLPFADLWIHGHLHCRHDYTVAHAAGRTRVVANARGHSHNGETRGYDGLFTVDA
jgi:hypothetical protein